MLHDGKRWHDATSGTDAYGRERANVAWRSRTDDVVVAARAMRRFELSG